MNRLLRANALIGSILLALPALAQEAKTQPVSDDSFFHRLELITGGYWAATLIGTIALGLAVGYFVYRAGVAGGRAGSATGSGCLVAILVFLAAQIVAVIVLVTTVFSVPINNGAAQDKAPVKTGPAKDSGTSSSATTSGASETTTTGGATTGTTGGTTGGAPKPSTGGSTTGDDF